MTITVSNDAAVYQTPPSEVPFSRNRLIEFSAEASDLGFPVGEFPPLFVYRGESYRLWKVNRVNDGDIVSVHYTSPTAYFVVLND